MWKNAILVSTLRNKDSGEETSIENRKTSKYEISSSDWENIRRNPVRNITIRLNLF